MGLRSSKMFDQEAKMEPPDFLNQVLHIEENDFPEGRQSTATCLQVACKLTFQQSASCRKEPAAGGEAFKFAAPRGGSRAGQDRVRDMHIL